MVDDDKMIEALPILSGKIVNTHRPTLFCIEFQTREGPKFFLAEQATLRSLADGFLKAANAVMEPRKPS
jgi:hypothetical protein